MACCGEKLAYGSTHAEALPELVGGSADLTPSNNTSVKAWKNFAPSDYAARYVHFGIREHAMASMMNGMALHGGILPYGGTFLIFSDYMRPAVRLGDEHTSVRLQSIEYARSMIFDGVSRIAISAIWT